MFFENIHKNPLLLTKLSIAYNAIMVVGKIILAIFTHSFFLGISALMNIGVGLAKLLALNGHKKTAEGHDSSAIQKNENRIYLLVGVIIFVTSVVYIAYGTRWITDDISIYYPRFIVIIMGIVAIFEIAIALYGTIKSRREHKPLMEAIKMMNCVSALTLFAFMKAALLAIDVGAETVLQEKF